MKIYNLTDEQYEDVAKSGMDLLLNQLNKDKVLTNEQLYHYHKNFFAVIKKPSIIASIWGKILGDKDKEQLILVEQKSLITPEGEK